MTIWLIILVVAFGGFCVFEAVSTAKSIRAKRGKKTKKDKTSNIVDHDDGAGRKE